MKVSIPTGVQFGKIDLEKENDDLLYVALGSLRVIKDQIEEASKLISFELRNRQENDEVNFRHDDM